MSVKKFGKDDFSWHKDQPDVPQKSAEDMKKFFDAPSEKLKEKIEDIIGGDETPSLAELQKNKQNTLTAGDGIQINNDKISVIGKQNTLKAGDGIQLKDDTISVPNATTTTLGAMKVGTGLGASSGTVSLKTASATQLGGVKVGDRLKISNGILSAEEQGTYVIDHLDLSVEEIAQLSKQCVDNKKVLIYANANNTLRYVCGQVYYSSTNVLAFFFVGYSKSGVNTLFRQSYDVETGQRTETEYTFETTKKEENADASTNITRSMVAYDDIDPKMDDFKNLVAGAQAVFNYVEKQIKELYNNVQYELSESILSIDDEISFLNNTLSARADYVTETGSDGIWTYKKWASGTYEAGCCYTEAVTIEPNGNSFYGHAAQITAPSFSKTVTNCMSNNSVQGVESWGTSVHWDNNISPKVYTTYLAENVTARICIRIEGTWK